MWGRSEPSLGSLQMKSWTNFSNFVLVLMWARISHTVVQNMTVSLPGGPNSVIWVLRFKETLSIELTFSESARVHTAASWTSMDAVMFVWKGGAFH